MAAVNVLCSIWSRLFFISFSSGYCPDVLVLYYVPNYFGQQKLGLWRAPYISYHLPNYRLDTSSGTSKK